MSEEHMDLRVRRTHKLLWEALMAELSQHSFEEITVRQICERAMVCGEGNGRFQKLVKEYLADVLSERRREVPLAICTPPFRPRCRHT